MHDVDGLPGREGAFLACSLWYAEALAATGQTGEARRTFERVLAARNDVGLLSEQWDPDTGRQLGNTPQAFSHLTLVETAFAVSSALSRSPGDRKAWDRRRCASPQGDRSGA
ncbi:hypothetical protein GCM10027074_14040 [Streptomyces deserti]